MSGAPSPWGAMLRAAVRLGIAPAAFWQLSLAEWRMLTESATAEAPISRGALAGLTEMWPDD